MDNSNSVNLSVSEPVLNTIVEEVNEPVLNTIVEEVNFIYLTDTIRKTINNSNIKINNIKPTKPINTFRKFKFI
jgi:hypothetical protein